MFTFAYGSNLDDGQMRSRCPTSRLDACAVLSDHALSFGGYSLRWKGAVANVLPQPGGRVQGLLYQIGLSDRDSLDRHEGHPHAYLRVLMTVIDQHGLPRRAFVYLKPQDEFQAAAPPDGYLAVIRAGYERLGFDLQPLLLASGKTS